MSAEDKERASGALRFSLLSLVVVLLVLLFEASAFLYAWSTFAPGMGLPDLALQHFLGLRLLLAIAGPGSPPQPVAVVEAGAEPDGEALLQERWRQLGSAATRRAGAALFTFLVFWLAS